MASAFLSSAPEPVKSPSIDITKFEQTEVSGEKGENLGKIKWNFGVEGRNLGEGQIEFAGLSQESKRYVLLLFR